MMCSLRICKTENLNSSGSWIFFASERLAPVYWFLTEPQWFKPSRVLWVSNYSAVSYGRILSVTVKRRDCLLTTVAAPNAVRSPKSVHCYCSAARPSPNSPEKCSTQLSLVLKHNVDEPAWSGLAARSRLQQSADVYIWCNNEKFTFVRFFIGIRQPLSFSLFYPLNGRVVALCSILFLPFIQLTPVLSTSGPLFILSFLPPCTSNKGKYLSCWRSVSVPP